jgi:hypothetical protein
MAALDRYEKKTGKLVLKEGQVHCYVLTQDWLYECTKEKCAVNVKPFLLSTIEGEELKEKRIANQRAAKPSKDVSRRYQTRISEVISLRGYRLQRRHEYILTAHASNIESS